MVTLATAPPGRRPHIPLHPKTQRSQGTVVVLVAQRILYSKAKRWAFLRTIGIGTIAVAAPVVTAINPKAAEIVASVSYAWVFLARTLFVAREHRHSSRAAEVQEQFDALIFGMPELALLDPG